MTVLIKRLWQDEVIGSGETAQRAFSACGQDLRQANLKYMNLEGVMTAAAGGDLRSSDLSGSSLMYATLRKADFTHACLYRTNLSFSDLEDANMSYVDLSTANLFKAVLRGVNLTGAVLPHFAVCPEAGAFIAYKKLDDSRIATLEIPAEAKRTSSLVGRKCRAEFVRTISIESRTGSFQYDEGQSIKTYLTDRPVARYRVGEITRPDSYDDDIRVECTHGIHFFITKKEAVEY